MQFTKKIYNNIVFNINYIYLYKNIIMNASSILTQIIGPLFIIISLGMIINTSNYKKMFKEIAKDSIILYISGFLSFIIGMLIVLFHNVWSLNWYIIITILWYIAVFKWISLIIFPDYAIKFSKKIVIKKSFLKTVWLVYLIIWVYISYLWYFC